MIAELFNQAAAREKCLVTNNLITLDDVKIFDSGDLDFGLMASNWIGRAKDGAAPFA